MKKLMFGALFGLLALATAAYAIQPGTSGTEKRFERQALRSAILTQPNSTVTSSGGAATLNAGSGVITTETLNVATTAQYSLTLTNSVVGAADVVLWTIEDGTATNTDITPQRSTPAAGSVVFTFKNTNATDLIAGTVKIRFLVIKQSAYGQD
jgi:hypothetical protein